MAPTYSAPSALPETKKDYRYSYGPFVIKRGYYNIEPTLVEAISTQYHDAAHKPTDSRTAIYTSATPLSAPTAATIVTENENIQPTHSEEPAQENTHHIYGYGQFQAFHQAHEDHIHGRLNNVEIQGPTCNQQTTAPSLVIADYLLGDEAFSDLRTFPTYFPTHPVPVSELESTMARATTSAAPLQASTGRAFVKHLIL
ncbi:hypothetical protein EJ07DRAFT_156468 [Lizonia empirigonia]|nr:hypothetical protein EJ07DRAFT_156468 [Lizonia empirigonia]